MFGKKKFWAKIIPWQKKFPANKNGKNIGGWQVASGQTVFGPTDTPEKQQKL